MEKYIVIVNHKYLVSVEANSHGGAEHRCLDLHYGIQYAQAFSRDDLRTEFFRDNAIDCETISFAELTSKTEAFKAAVEYENQVRNAIEETNNRIQKLLNDIEFLKESKESLVRKLDESLKEHAEII